MEIRSWLMDFGRTLAAVLVRDSIPLLEIEPYTSGAVKYYCPISLLILTEHCLGLERDSPKTWNWLQSRILW